MASVSFPATAGCNYWFHICQSALCFVVAHCPPMHNITFDLKALAQCVKSSSSIIIDWSHWCDAKLKPNWPLGWLKPRFRRFR